MSAWTDELAGMSERERGCWERWLDALLDDDPDTAAYWRDQGLAEKETRLYSTPTLTDAPSRRRIRKV